MHRYYTWVFAVLTCLCIASVDAQIVHIWDLADATQPGQFTIFNPDPNDAEFGTPITAGDINGDGRDELVISAMAGDGPDNGRSNAGEVAIYFGEETIAGQLDLSLDDARVVTVYGEAMDDIFGIKAHVGDVTGDGVQDLLVGAFYADGEGRQDAGKLYIISGLLLMELHAGSRVLDLAEPWPSGVSVVTGPEGRSRLGVWMSSGDVNGDGFEDVLVSADQASGMGGAVETGRVYVLYGPLAADARLDLANTEHPLSIIYGVDAFDHAGSSLASGDIDGDGFADVIIGAGAFGTLRNAYDRQGGAGDGPGNTRENAGEIYAVFGGAGWPRDIDLAGVPSVDVLVAYGADGGDNSPDRFGEEVIAADVNGDGMDEILVGAYRADGPENSRSGAGEAYIIYGSAGLRGAQLDMAEKPEGVTVIYGTSADAISGDSIAAGDMHGDGYADLFIGVPGDAGPLNRRSAGGSVVLAGGPALPREIDLANPVVPVVWIVAPDAFDYSAYWAASGDVDGDGRIDAIPNGMAGDGPDNMRDNAGEAHIVSGARLAEYLPGVAATTVEVEHDASPIFE